MPTWTDFKREIKAHEGSISHMYLDTVGKVTVGVGNMLPNVGEAQRLGFVERTSQRAATRDAIKADFEAVSKQPRGRIASSYQPHTKLDLPQMAIDTLLDSRIEGFKNELRQKFPSFESYPITVQFALLDMAFNLGTNGVVTKFPKFTRLITAQDWKGAAGESNRPQVNSSRNMAVKKWLEDAAPASVAAPTTVTLTFKHAGKVPKVTEGLTSTADSLYESTVTIGGLSASTLRGSIYPDNMNVKGRLKDGTYDLYLGFHKRSGTPTQSDVTVRTQNFRAALVVNLDKDVPVQSNSASKTTSNAIHVHNGFNSKRYSEGCLTLHPDDWKTFLSLFIKAYPNLSDWTSTNTYVGKKIGSVVVSA